MITVSLWNSFIGDASKIRKNSISYRHFKSYTPQSVYSYRYFRIHEKPIRAYTLYRTATGLFTFATQGAA